ncbi:MAG: hypothetical protein HYW69_00615 [Candidatus Nealsonbacteria bacterium]|nr:hypothetical protein [Candidatus Nealsonbacteria bacterium]
MRHRIFIAINLPEDIKKQLTSYQYLWPELPVRWIKSDNLHITLDFLGYVSDEELLNVFQNAEELASGHKSFDITLNKICYGPLNKIPPRMIWAVGEKIQEFNLIPHITLGRIKTWAWKQIEPEERPEISKEINLSFEVESIEVMESVLKKGGPEYEILESYPLKEA